MTGRTLICGLLLLACGSGCSFLLRGKDAPLPPEPSYRDSLNYVITNDLSSLPGLDHAIDSFMDFWSLHGVSLAITRHDSLLYAKVGNFLFSYKLPYTYRKSRFEDRGYFQIAAGEQVLVNLKSWSDQLSPYESSGRNVITFSDSDYNALGAVKQKAEKEIVRDLEEITGTVLEKSADQIGRAHV